MGIARARTQVPDESVFQTIAMHSAQHKRLLLNHNLRWIDWPHSHGDPNEYWGRLGSRKYVGGPKVLNASEMRDVLASPYMFARKVRIQRTARGLHAGRMSIAR